MKKALCLILCLITLNACVPYIETRYAYNPPLSAAGQRCTAICQSNAGLCSQLCEQNEESCLARKKEDALSDYHDYIHKRERKGKPVDLKLRNFDDSYQCYTACDSRCTASLNQCYQGCGGRVRAYEVCTAFCDQPEQTAR